MIIHRLAACTLMVSVAAAGCGPSANNAVTPVATPANNASPSGAEQPAESDISGTQATAPNATLTGGQIGATPTATPSTPAQSAAPTAPPPPQDPPPRAEQIARWTPPPFEPLQLLAVRQWQQPSYTSQLAAAPDGSHYIVAGSRVLFWPLTADEPEHVFLDLSAEGADRELRALAVSPDGKWFAVGDSEGTLRIWSLENRQELASKRLYRTAIQHLAISPDAAEIATISYNNEATVWTADALEQKRTFKVTASGIKTIEYVGPNLLAAAGESTTMWDTSTGIQARDLAAGRYNYALARTPDGTKFIFGADQALKIWDVAEARPDATVIRGVAGDVLLAVSHDGKTLATSNGRSVELWSLSDGRRLQSIEGFGWTVVGLSWLPTTNLLAVASDIGVTRLWGTPTQGESLGLWPLHSAVAMPDAASKAPETPEQLARRIDWRAFPTLPGSKTGMHSPTDLSSVAPVSVPEARTFYRYFLTKAGWTESPPNPNDPTSFWFRKDGSEISGYLHDTGDGETDIRLSHAGSYDVRWAPKADGAAIEIVGESARFSTYRVQASILEIETSLLRKLHQDGWAAYSRLKSSHNEQTDSRDFSFLRNGATLRVTIGKSPNDSAGIWTVQHAMFSNDTWAPIPPDAGFVEFDGSSEPALVAITKMSLSEAREFYDSELTANGWLTHSIGRALKDEQNWLPYLRDQCNLTVSLTKLDDGRTLVRIGAVSDSIWEASQPTEDQGDELPVEGLQASDFPLLNDTKTGKFESLRKNIEVPFDGSTLANVADIYTKALAELGWTAEERGIRDEEYTFFNFTKGDRTISLRARKMNGVAIASFEGNGLLWTKELPGGKQVVSYETWLRQSKLPPSLEYVERYETEMKAIPGM